MRSTRSFKFKLFNVVMGIFVVLKLLHIRQHRVRTKQPNLSRKSKNLRIKPLTLPLIDIILMNDEMDMLEYRLKLHCSIVTKFVIVESNLTFKGRPKPLYAKSLLATCKLEQFNIEVLQVPFSQSERESNDTWVKELATRRFIGYWISQHYPNATVALSDVDELFDTYALQKVFQTPELNNLPCFFYPCDFFTMEKRVP